jgi:fibronectin type 3 domain-containing protein
VTRAPRGAGAALAIVLAMSVACAGAPSRTAPEPTPAVPSLVYDPPVELPAPESLIATGGQYREIPLRWDPVLLPDVAGYLIESSLASDGPYLARKSLLNRGTLAWVDRDTPDSPLGDDATRFYRLRSLGHDGSLSSRVSEVAVATTAALPAPPEGLFAYSRQPRSVPLAWTASDDPIVAGYTVERSPGPEGPFEVVAELEGRHTTHLLDDGLGDLRVLFYRVSSRNPGGEHGEPSAVVRAVTKPEPLPPIALHVKERRLGEIALAWEPNVERDLLGYRLRRRRDGGGVETVTYIGAGETRAEDPEVGAGEVVLYDVIAVDRDGLESRPSEPVVGRGVGYAWRITASSEAVTLHWNPREDEGYAGARVTRSSGLWQSESFTTQGGEWIDRDVEPGRTYRYRIALLREDGSEAPISRPAVVAVPLPGEPFVEIQAPASILRPPEGIPR